MYQKKRGSILELKRKPRWAMNELFLYSYMLARALNFLFTASRSKSSMIACGWIMFLFVPPEPLYMGRKSSDLNCKLKPPAGSTVQVA